MAKKPASPDATTVAEDATPGDATPTAAIMDTIDAGQERLINVWSQANQAGWLTLVGLDPKIMEDDAKIAPEDEDKIVLFVSGMGDAASWACGDFALYVRGKVRGKARDENWPPQKYNEIWGTEFGTHGAPLRSVTQDIAEQHFDLHLVAAQHTRGGRVCALQAPRSPAFGHAARGQAPPLAPLRRERLDMGAALQGVAWQDAGRRHAG